MTNTLPSSGRSLAKEITALFGPLGGVDLNSEGAVIPARLSAGDKVRFVSPASAPDKDKVVRAANILESWGLSVDFGQHAFDRFGFLAGSDEDRLADLNAAFRDSSIRAIFATRGGKGSYRLADRLDFTAIRQDPKWVIGFSDITSLHLSLWHVCRLASVYGAITDVNDSNEALRALLMTSSPIIIRAQDDETTACLTTTGSASGRLIGGNLDIIATSIGWLLPKLEGAVLLLEAINMGRGLVDRELMMLRKGGHLRGVAGIAIGQFTDFESSGGITVIDLLEEHLQPLGVPILGGLPIGHGSEPRSVILASMAHINASRREMILTT